MNKNVYKTMVAAVCVVIAGMGGTKAYNAGNQSETNMILSENVDALSDPEIKVPCYFSAGECVFNATNANGESGTVTVIGIKHV